jgi:indole-3-glycerol phosphate synthase
MSLLADILATKAREVAALRDAARARSSHEPIDVVAALRRRPPAALRLIAEVKLRSPSAGPLSRALAPDARAAAYASAGASMVSVLCDRAYFDGGWEHLASARAALDRAHAAGGAEVPLLAKEFVIDERQIDEARDRGADAVLLIARIVAPERLGALARFARERAIEPLIEVVDERELASALDADARVVGVNARDLDTLAMDADRTARVLAAIPPDRVSVHLSGLKTERDVAAIATSHGGRVDAALIGEALMRADDPRPLLTAMVTAARS